MRTLFSRYYALANLRENKVLSNKKCFTVAYKVSSLYLIAYISLKITLMTVSKSKTYFFCDILQLVCEEDGNTGVAQ